MWTSLSSRYSQFSLTFEEFDIDVVSDKFDYLRKSC